MRRADAAADRIRTGPHPIAHPHAVLEDIDRGRGAFERFNGWLADHLVAAVGTMMCAYLFTLLALVSLPSAIGTSDPIIIVSWIAQTFVQLVLLPVIIVGQNRQADRERAKSEADHRASMHLYEINDEQLSLLKDLNHTVKGGLVVKLKPEPKTYDR